MMHPCKKCLENNWRFSHNEGWITAQCNLCGNEVTFESRKSKNKDKKEMEEGDLCRCGRGNLKLEESPFKAKKLSKLFYYSHYFRCQVCKVIFMDNRFRVYNQERCKQNIAASIRLGDMVAGLF